MSLISLLKGAHGLLKGLETRRQHLDSLKERHESKTRCPKCGSDLVERLVKAGERAGQKFLGCSAFPKCRFTKPMNSD